MELPSLSCVFTVMGPAAKTLHSRFIPSLVNEGEVSRVVTSKLIEYIVEWDFEAQHGGEVSVEAGEIVYLLSNRNADWIKVKRKDNVGLL